MKRSILALFLAVVLVCSCGVSAFAEDAPTVCDLKDCTVTLGRAEVTYTGNEHTPSVLVENGATKLTRDTDYTVVYSDNINAGTATVTVTAAVGSTLYTGKNTATFKIAKMDISLVKNKVLSDTDFVYSGSAKKPSLSVYGDRYKPVYGKDYSVSYKNNVYTGVASVICKGTGNYNGTFTKRFYIHPQKVTGLKQSETTSTSLKLSWNALGGKVTSYRAYRYDRKTNAYKTITTTKNTYCTVSKLSSGTTYTYVVRAFKNSEGKNVYGAFSDFKTAVTNSAQVQTHDSSFRGKYFIINWSKTACSGYQIQYSKDKSFKKGVKVIERPAKSIAYNVKLSKNKTYYYRVRAYRTLNNRRYYGAWSVRKTTYYSNVYATYTTYFDSPAGRTTNIKRASKYIDGTTLSPGEVFSFNGIVGRRTPERGFKLAPVFSGQDHLMGYGGGVCQVSSTLFNAALLANLQIVERSQHSMKVSYVPSGRDAAISWGSQNMQFKNNTDFEIKVSCKVYDNSRIVVKLLTNSITRPKKVSLKVTQSGKHYTLRRYVSGKCNYTTGSTY